MHGFVRILVGGMLAMAMTNAVRGNENRIVVSEEYVVLSNLEWVEFEVIVPSGTYEVWVTSGGNDTRQCARLSIDGGEPVLIIDEREPAKGLPPREREKVSVRQLVGVVSLKRGKHFFKVQHAGEAGFSVAFGLERIELLRTKDIVGKKVIKVGSQRKPSPRAKEPWESKEFIPAPKWWQKEEVYAGFYDRLNDGALKRIKDKGLRVVVIGCDEIARGELRHWANVAHELGLKVLPYVSFHTWRWRFSAEEGKERLADADLVSSFKFAQRHRGELRWLEYWALADHPEWMLLNAEGKTVSPFNPDYQAGSIREPCIDAEGVVDACLSLVKLLMDEGADGIFVDNVHPTEVCYGEKFGLHKHLHPNWTNAAAYKELLRQVRALVKRYGKEKIVMLNSGSPQKRFAGVGDSLMWESFLFDGSDEPKMRFEQVLGAKRYWDSYIKAGGTIAVLSYVGGTTSEEKKQNAFYAYACAKLCGFHFSDWFSADGTGAEVLYRIRLGKPLGDVEVREGVYLRKFVNGFVVVNPEGDGQPKETVAKIPSRTLSFAVPSHWREVVDMYDGTIIPVKGGKVTISIPAMSGRVFVSK